MGCSPPPAHTVDEAVLLLRVDAGEVAGTATAIPLRVLPGAPAGKVPVAVTLELVPVVVTALRVCREMGTVRGTGPPAPREGMQGTSSPSRRGQDFSIPVPAPHACPQRDRGWAVSPWGSRPPRGNTPGGHTGSPPFSQRLPP